MKPLTPPASRDSRRPKLPPNVPSSIRTPAPPCPVWCCDASHTVRTFELTPPILSRLDMIISGTVDMWSVADDSVVAARLYMRSLLPRFLLRVAMPLMEHYRTAQVVDLVWLCYSAKVHHFEVLHGLS